MHLPDSIPMGLALADKAGWITDANRRLKDWFGLMDPAPPGSAAADHDCIVCGASCSWLCREMRAWVAGDRTARFRHRFQCGSALILDARCEPLLDAPGYILVVEDVTATHPQDRLLQIFRHTLENAPEMVGIAGPGRRPLWANPAAGRMIERLGWHPEGGLGAKSIDDVQPLIGGHDVATALAASGQRPVDFENSPLCRVGESEPSAWVSQRIISWRDDVTGDMYYSTICFDVTASVEAERSLRDANQQLSTLLADRSRELVSNREFFRSLVETNRDLVLSADGTGVINFSNSGFLGSAAGTLIGKQLAQFVEGSYREDVARQCDDVLSGRQQHVMFEAVGTDALRDRWCLFSVGAVRSGGVIVGFTAIVSDMTALNEAWDRLRNSEKLIATGRMAARIAHEINNPLTGIAGAIQLIKADLPAESQAMHYADLVDREIKRISNIVRQMYGLYRPEQEPAKTLDLQPLLGEIAILMRVDAMHRQVRLQANVGGPEFAIVQEQNLRQILINIIRNAIEVTPPGGEVEVSIQRHGRCVDVLVADEGPGITDEVRQQMFEPFFSTKASTSGRGLGLGLSISDTLVKAMGGRIEFENRPEGGACCRICLPEAGIGSSVH